MGENNLACQKTLLCFDVIMLSEIGRCHLQSFCNMLPDYAFEFVSPLTKCGGVGIFYKRNFIKINVMKNVINRNLNCQCSNCQVEELWLDVKRYNRCYKFVVCYRHPKGNINHFIEALEPAIMSVTSKEVCVFGGDLNIDLLKINEIATVKSYYNLMSCYLFYTSHNLTHQTHRYFQYSHRSYLYSYAWPTYRDHLWQLVLRHQ